MEAKPETKQDEEQEKIPDEFEGLDIESLFQNSESTNQVPQKNECIVGDEELVGLYEEILDNARKDRTSIDEVLGNFLDMVMNDGDSSSASKEAIVNLIKIKTDISDKMAKVADLKTRIKLRERDTFPAYMNNKVVIEGSQRDLIKSVNKLTDKRKKNDKQDK